MPAKLPCMAAMGRCPEIQESSSSELSLLLFKIFFIFSKLTKVSMTGFLAAAALASPALVRALACERPALLR